MLCMNLHRIWHGGYSDPDVITALCNSFIDCGS
jgi:hypothetical protein